MMTFARCLAVLVAALMLADLGCLYFAPESTIVWICTLYTWGQGIVTIGMLWEEL